MASFAAGVARARVESLPSGSPLARVRPGENVVQLRSQRYSDLPLTLAGPGAGPDLTAGNLLADLIDAGHELVRAQRRLRERRRWNPELGEGAGALPHGACY